MEMLYDLLTLNSMLFSPSYPNFISLKHQHVVCVRLASVLAKRYNDLITHCYLYVREMPIIPKLPLKPNFVIETKFLKVGLYLNHTESVIS